MFKKIHNFWLEHIQPRIIRFLLLVTRGDFLYISIALVLTVVIIFWAVESHNDLTNVVELSTFSAVVLEGALVALVVLFRSRLQSFTEDPEKLTDNYDKLVKRYSSEPNLIWTRDREEKLSVFPVVHVAWLCDKEIVVEDYPEKEFVLPEIINQHYEELYNTHLTSKIFNNTNIRVNDWFVDTINDNDKPKFHIVTGRTSYYSSLVTNRAMDYEIKKGITVRELLECGPMVHPLKYSKLSNHLGFNGFVETSDKQIIFIKRKKNVSIGKRTWGNSVGASLKAKYGLDETYHFSREGLYNAIVREIEDELGVQSLTLEKREHDQRVTLISAYRDMLEGGKPQLLFYARTSMSKSELIEGFKGINKIISRKSFNRDENEIEMETDGFELYPMDIEDLKNCQVYPDRIVHSGYVMKMLPSASACVTLFQLYLNSKETPKTSFGMKVLETKLVGKNGSEEKCEDGIFCGKRFVAVVDGVTSKTGALFEGKTSGQKAMEIVRDTFSQLDNILIQHLDTPEKILAQLNNALKSEMKRLHIDGTQDRLKASVIFFDRVSKTVVSYGDCQCRIGDIVFDNVKKVDVILSEKRAEIIYQALNSGKSVDEIRKTDIGRAAIIDEMKEYCGYENINGEYGYPVLNGDKINESMIKTYVVKEGEPVILCSDGYPKVCASLKESEEVLERLLSDDPLLIGNNELVFKTTKAVMVGNDSFDDRAWVQLG